MQFNTRRERFRNSKKKIYICTIDTCSIRLKFSYAKSVYMMSNVNRDEFVLLLLLCTDVFKKKKISYVFVHILFSKRVTEKPYHFVSIRLLNFILVTCAEYHKSLLYDNSLLQFFTCSAIKRKNPKVTETKEMRINVKIPKLMHYFQWKRT